ncbi:hypothetical protein [Flavobacterium tegetincola]|uniref:hypothetical protein n=1 Tax=Flavobacterium tegetincola TaxID=150172 RepID=UPI0003FB9508|nr:hypothetical protein [Flavobacterium tegetincola]
MDLKNLYNNFISEGYTNFYIEGIVGTMKNDVHCLGFDNQNWTVYYTERGIKSKPIFSTADKEVAMAYYSEFVSKIEHWHLIAFTRSNKILDDFKYKLEQLGIKTIQNDIPNFRLTVDRVYRLFVIDKDIFIAKKHIENIPYFDTDLKNYMK